MTLTVDPFVSCYGFVLVDKMSENGENCQSVLLKARNNVLKMSWFHPQPKYIQFTGTEEEIFTCKKHKSENLTFFAEKITLFINVGCFFTVKLDIHWFKVFINILWKHHKASLQQIKTLKYMNNQFCRYEVRLIWF